MCPVRRRIDRIRKQRDKQGTSGNRLVKRVLAEFGKRVISV